MIDIGWVIAFYVVVGVVGTLLLRPHVERALRRIGLLGAPQPKVAKALRVPQVPVLFIVAGSPQQASLYQRRARLFLPERAVIRMGSSVREGDLRGCRFGPMDFVVIAGTLASELHVNQADELPVLRQALAASGRRWVDAVWFAPDFACLDIVLAEYRRALTQDDPW